MNDQVLRAVVIIATIFPFVMVGYKLFEEESLITGGLYTAIIVILFATVYAAWRAKPTTSDAPPTQEGRQSAKH